MRKTSALLLGLVGIASFVGLAGYLQGTTLQSDLIQNTSVTSSGMRIGAYYTPVLEEAPLKEMIDAYPGRLPILSKEDIASGAYLKKEAETAQGGGIDFFIIESKDIKSTEEKQFFSTFSAIIPANFSYAISIDAEQLSNSASIIEIKNYVNSAEYLRNSNLKPILYIKNIELLAKQLDNKEFTSDESFSNTKVFFENLRSSLQAELVAVDDLSPKITGEFPFDEETYREVYTDIKSAIANGTLSSARQHYEIDLSRPAGQQERRVYNTPYKEYYFEKRLPLIIADRLTELGFTNIAGYSGIEHLEKTEPLAFYSNYRKVMERFINRIILERKSISFTPSLLAGWDPRPVVDMKSIPAVISEQTPQEFEELGKVYISSMNLTKNPPDFLLLNSWNNYAYMEPVIPTLQWNNQYLSAISHLKSYIAKESTIHAAVPKRVLFLGNSLTLHPPLADANWDGLSWDGNWGMAASTEEQDYVHQVQKIAKENGTPITPILPGKDIPSGGGVVYGFLSTLQKEAIKSSRPDIVVIQLAENRESPQDASLEYVMYEKNYRALLAFLKTDVKVPVLTVSSWGESSLAQGPHNQIIQSLSNEFNAELVDITSVVNNPLSHPSSNEHNWMPGVLWHPGDAGMRGIAEKISQKLLPHLRK